MTTLARILRKFYVETPTRVSIVLQFASGREYRLTYEQLVKGANNYAHWYAKQNIEPGDVIILILQHGVDLIFAFWGAILYGSIPAIIPFLSEKISPERYQENLISLISITQPSAIVTSSQLEENIREIQHVGGFAGTVIIANEVNDALSLDFNLLDGFKREPEDIVLLQHSSGTTGLQKGVALSNQSVLNQLDAYSAAIRLDPENDVIVSWLPLYHDMGLIASFLLPVLKGVPLVLMSPFDWVRAPYKLLQAVTRYKGTLTWLPNFAYIFCARKIRDYHLSGVDLSSWRAVINCSEPVRWESHKAFYERFKNYGLKLESLQTSYAMAENTFGVTQSDISRCPSIDVIDRDIFLRKQIARSASDKQSAITMMSSGKVISNTRIRILDENGNDVAERIIGEIAIKSNSMLTEYYNRPDVTNSAFREGWYMTGDYGYLVGDELFVTGRKKDLIIVGGKNIYPQDIEMLVHEVSGVHPGRAVAFGVYNEHLGTEDVVVVAEADTDDEQERIALADMVRHHVTVNSDIALRYVRIVPRGWIVKTSSGKLSRKANREKYLREYQSK